MTKNNPGEFDCCAKTADDELLFTLRAKDPVAPYFVLAWRAARAGDLIAAVDCIARAVRALQDSGRTLLPYDTDKPQEAQLSASEMKIWYDKNIKSDCSN